MEVSCTYVIVVQVQLSCLEVARDSSLRLQRIRFTVLKILQYMHELEIASLDTVLYTA